MLLIIMPEISFLCNIDIINNDIPRIDWFDSADHFVFPQPLEPVKQQQICAEQRDRNDTQKHAMHQLRIPYKYGSDTDIDCQYHGCNHKVFSVFLQDTPAVDLLPCKLRCVHLRACLKSPDQDGYKG